MEETKRMVNAQAWVEDNLYIDMIRRTHAEDISLSAWIRKACREKLERDTKNKDEKKTE